MGHKQTRFLRKRKQQTKIIRTKRLRLQGGVNEQDRGGKQDDKQDNRGASREDNQSGVLGLSAVEGAMQRELAALKFSDLKYTHTTHGNVEVHKVEIPSKRLKITMHNFPKVGVCTVHLNGLVYRRSEWLHRPLISTFIHDILSDNLDIGEIYGFVLIVNVQVAVKLKMVRGLVYVSVFTTPAEFVQSICVACTLDPTEYFLSSVVSKTPSGPSKLYWFKDKLARPSIWQQIVASNTNEVTAHVWPFVTQDRIYNEMTVGDSKPAFRVVGDTLSKTKLVSTFETMSGMSALAQNMYLIQDLDALLLKVFKTTHVKAMFNDPDDELSKNPVVFYVEPYVNELAAKLGVTPQELLSVASKTVSQDDTPKFTLIMLLFGDFEENVFRDFVPDEKIMEVYKAYLANSENLVHIEH